MQSFNFYFLCTQIFFNDLYYFDIHFFFVSSNWIFKPSNFVKF